MSNEISRRSFLKGAAATAVSAALLGVTGSKAVMASAEGEAPEAQETWYDAKYFAKPDPITDIAETIETDVVVVGAGNGGLVAAASVVDLGAKLTLVEKNAMWITWAGEMGAYNTKLMKEKYGIEYTEEEMLEMTKSACYVRSMPSVCLFLFMCSVAVLLSGCFNSYICLVRFGISSQFAYIVNV